MRNENSLRDNNVASERVLSENYFDYLCSSNSIAFVPLIQLEKSGADRTKSLNSTYV